MERCLCKVNRTGRFFLGIFSHQPLSYSVNSIRFNTRSVPVVRGPMLSVDIHGDHGPSPQGAQGTRRFLVILVRSQHPAQ